MHLKVKHPTLIIDEEKARRNIQRMAEKAGRNNISLRPHCKTHQSSKVAEWYRDSGIKTITVSSVKMAEYFAKNGWDDITIAFPYNLLEYKEIERLAKKIKLNLTFESLESMIHAQRNIKASLNYFVKIDVGYNRTGLEIHQIDEVMELVSFSDKRLLFSGLLTHAGNTYESKDIQGIKNVYHNSLVRIEEFVSEFNLRPFISFGDTPSCSVIEEFNGINEIRCGNFIYYDLTQSEMGAAEIEDISVAVACPIVAKHENRSEIIIYGGAVHFSKDRILKNGKDFFGQVIDLDNWEVIEGAYLAKLSQEHGILKVPKNKFKNYEIGGLVGVLPVHSCLVADMLNSQQTLRGDKITKMDKV